MGTTPTNCKCCLRDDKDTQNFNEDYKNPLKFEGKTENNIFSANLNENKLAFRQIQESSASENKNDLRQFVYTKSERPQEKQAFSLQSKLTFGTINCTKNESYIIEIQRIFRGSNYRKKYLTIKQNQIKELKALVKELKEKYHNDNVNKIEIKHNEKYSPDGWKELYNEEGLSDKISFFQYDYGEKFHSSLMITKFPNSGFYIGEVNIKNQKHGYGCLYLSDGMKYEGSWKEDVFSGWGRMINTEGILIEGCFNNGKLQGKGIEKNLNGHSYRGDFVDNQKEGKGKEITTEIEYIGEFKKGLRNGKGKLKYKHLEDLYEGEFVDNKITGEGKYIWANKDTYEGTFIDGKMHGKGLYKWPDGGEYYGDYVNNIKEGKGVFKWANGKIFDGQFKDGKPHGFGTMKIGKVLIEVEFLKGKLLTNLKTNHK